MSMKITAQDAWAAGIVNVLGSFYSNTHMTPAYSIKVSSYRQAVDRLGLIMGVDVRETTYRGKKLSRMTVTGEALEAFMERLWPGLMPERRKEYQYVVDLAQNQRHAAAALTARSPRPPK